MTFSRCMYKIRECRKNLRMFNKFSSKQQWNVNRIIVDRNLYFLLRERETEKDDVPLTLPHFYCRKSGSANALVTRRFPVTCCPRSMSPRISLPRPMNERNPCQQDPVARSSWPGFRSSPLWLESALQTFRKFSRMRNPFFRTSSQY